MAKKKAHKKKHVTGYYAVKRAKKGKNKGQSQPTTKGTHYPGPRAARDD